MSDGIWLLIIKLISGMYVASQSTLLETVLLVSKKAWAFLSVLKEFEGSHLFLLAV